VQTFRQHAFLRRHARPAEIARRAACRSGPSDEGASGNRWGGPRTVPRRVGRESITRNATEPEFGACAPAGARTVPRPQRVRSEGPVELAPMSLGWLRAADAERPQSVRSADGPPSAAGPKEEGWWWWRYSSAGGALRTRSIRGPAGARTVRRPQRVRSGGMAVLVAMSIGKGTRCGRGASAVRAERGRSSVRSGCEAKGRCNWFQCPLAGGALRTRSVRSPCGARTVPRPQRVRRGRDGGGACDVPQQAKRCGRGASAVRPERGRSPVRSGGEGGGTAEVLAMSLSRRSGADAERPQSVRSADGPPSAAGAKGEGRRRCLRCPSAGEALRTRSVRAPPGWYPDAPERGCGARVRRSCAGRQRWGRPG